MAANGKVNTISAVAHGYNYYEMHAILANVFVYTVALKES